MQTGLVREIWRDDRHVVVATMPRRSSEETRRGVRNVLDHGRRHCIQPFELGCVVNRGIRATAL
jgi:hypothetical protein